MNHIILICYLIAIFLGISSLTMSILARRRGNTGLNNSMLLFSICLIVMCIYDMVIYYTDYFIAGYNNIELLRFGDCIIAILFISWLSLEQKLTEEDILEGYYKMARFYAIGYAVVWCAVTIIFSVEFMYTIKWILLVSDIVLIFMMLTGSIAYMVAALYKRSDRTLTIYMVIITAMLTWNYGSYFWGETSVYWGNSRFIREPLDLTIIFWFVINIVMIYMVYRRAFVPAYFSNEEKRSEPSLEDRLEKVGAEYDLTEREKELVALIYEGRSNAEIAEALFISESTVKTHIYNIFKKMKIKNRMSVMRIVRGEEETTECTNNSVETKNKQHENC